MDKLTFKIIAFAGVFFTPAFFSNVPDAHAGSAIVLEVDGLSYADIACAAYAVHHEARGEPLRGQYAVVHTILNRVAAGQYPNSICRAVYQDAQFSGLTPEVEYDLKKETVRIAYAAIIDWHKGHDVTGGATMYFNPDKANPKWNWGEVIFTKRIGAHKFYREKRIKFSS